MIVNSEEELFAELENRVSSGFKTSERIHFGRYGADELVGILEDRVRWGLHADTANTRKLRMVADASAGDARIAIGTLRTAAQKAVVPGLQELTDDLIGAAAPKAKA